MNFEVSVIIPVYNAELFIKKAVSSALTQQEVKEVIVINDGSTDGTFEILQDLKSNNEKLIIATHPGGQNLGRSASRNLGIRTATSNYIAFLDADDYYLADRFKNDKRIFLDSPEIDGVYNAIGAQFYRPPKEGEEARYGLTTIKSQIPANRLFYEMAPVGNAGWFSGDGLTVKRTIFEKSGFFNEDLEVAEDADLWIRMALTAKLIEGILDRPVSIRGVHDENVFHLYGTELYKENMAKMYRSLLSWAYENELKSDVLEHFWRMTYKYFSFLKVKKSKSEELTIVDWMKFSIMYPRLLNIKYFHFTNPLYQLLQK